MQFFVILTILGLTFADEFVYLHAPRVARNVKLTTADDIVRWTLSERPFVNCTYDLKQGAPIQQYVATNRGVVYTDYGSLHASADMPPAVIGYIEKRFKETADDDGFYGYESIFGYSNYESPTLSDAIEDMILNITMTATLMDIANLLFPDEYAEACMKQYPYYFTKEALPQTLYYFPTIVAGVERDTPDYRNYKAVTQTHCSPIYGEFAECFLQLDDVFNRFDTRVKSYLELGSQMLLNKRVVDKEYVNQLVKAARKLYGKSTTKKTSRKSRAIDEL